MKSVVINVNEAINGGAWKWGKTKNDVEFKGVIPGLVCGFCVECKKDNKIDYCSTTFTNDFEEIKIPSYFESVPWNDLGISAELAQLNGWEITGRIVFRGYYNEVWDFAERESGYVPAIR